MNLSASEKVFAEASKVLVGGVNSPVRAYRSVGGTPVVIREGHGAWLTDADGNRYIDYVNSYGPHLLGHGHPAIVEAIREQAGKGISFGATTEQEVQLAHLVLEAFPFAEKVRFVNSGTEAAMSALRLARAATERQKIVKFAGCYHGHSDFLLAQAGSGMLTLSIPGSAGVPQATVSNTLIAEYNDLDQLEALFEEEGHDIAAVAIEPVPGNMGVVLPKEGFLEGVRHLCSKYGALLLFDEVMSGFRYHFGGVQAVVDAEPDIVILGKIIGGGLPVGAYAARAELMDMVAPLGPVYQAGTLSGNPLAMAAGIAMLSTIKSHPELIGQASHYTKKLCSFIKSEADAAGVPVVVEQYGSMFTPFLTSEPVVNYESAKKCDTAKFAKLFWSLMEDGVYPPPSQFEAWFVSAACTEEELDSTATAFRSAFRKLI